MSTLHHLARCGACGKKGAYLLGWGNPFYTVHCRYCKAARTWGPTTVEFPGLETGAAELGRGDRAETNAAHAAWERERYGAPEESAP